MPRKKKTSAAEETLQEEKKVKKTKKSRAKKAAPVAAPAVVRETKKSSSNIVSYIILVLLVVFIIFFAATYTDIKKVKDEVSNVKTSVTDQNSGSVGYLQNEIERLKQQLADKEQQIEEISGVYVNKEYQLQFEIPVDATQKSGIVDDDGLIMFGPTKDFDGVVLPEFTLRVYEDEDIEDYQEKIKFMNETCDVSDCIMLDVDYEDIDEDRDIALESVLEEVQVNDLNAWKITLNQECLVPTIIVYNTERDTLYEFQQQCAVTETQGYQELMSIVESLVFTD